jgi:hypothetical protein
LATKSVDSVAILARARLIPSRRYNVYFSGTASGDNIGGLYAADAYSGGELVGSVTAD